MIGSLSWKEIGDNRKENKQKKREHWK